MPDTEQEYKKQIKELEQQIRFLREQVDFLTRKLYGTKSEKMSALEIEGQMSLFNELESCASPDAHEQDLAEVEKHLCKRKYAGQRKKLIKDIPRSKVLHTIDESEQICERCGSAMVEVGEEFVRTEVQFIPASLKVVDHYRETYECRACRKNGTPYMEKSPALCSRLCTPLRLLPRFRGSSIRSLNWVSLYTARKRNGVLLPPARFYPVILMHGICVEFFHQLYQAADTGIHLKEFLRAVGAEAKQCGFKHLLL